MWAFERHWKLPPEGPVSAALVTGSAYHRCLEREATARMHGEDINRDELPDLFTTLLERQVEDDGEVNWKKTSQEEAAEQGRKLVKCHLDNINPDERVLAVNQTFCVPLVDADGNVAERPLIGEADCIVDSGKGAVVVDWKTSATRYSTWKVAKSPQATAMLYGIGRSHGPVGSFRFDIVVKLKRAPAYETYSTTRTQDDYDRLGALAIVAERIVEAELFHPAEGGFASPCGYCRHKGACAKWHKARARTIVDMAA